MISLNKVYCEDCRETMKRMDDNSVDSIVTDPPYELGFMGKKWDSSGIAYDVDLWRECLRVLKPGGYLLAFGGTRTSHRMVCAIEDAGFEIRDSILWLYGSGFPKSMDISKQIDKEAGIERKIIGRRKHPTLKDTSLLTESKSAVHTLADTWKREWDLTAPATIDSEKWQGWGTALKPAHEPICVARKPISEKTVAQNVLKYGTGGINIDGCRVETYEQITNHSRGSESAISKGKYGDSIAQETHQTNGQQIGRFPANVILDPFTANELDKQAPDAGAFAKVKSGHNGKSKGIYGDYAEKGDDGDTFYDDKGGASRFFYIAKADKDERNAGLHQFENKYLAGSNQAKAELKRGNTEFKGNGDGESGWLEVKATKNNHPTVKPVKLIQYLQRLVTPKGGLTYDPFGGSGTSALSAQNEGFNWILSEKEPEHCDIAEKRIYNNGGLFL